MKIAGYLKTSLIEWPGKIASVIFVPGCNFHCPFCHNADLVDPKKIKKIRLITEREILADLKKRRKWIDGVALSVHGDESVITKRRDLLFHDPISELWNKRGETRVFKQPIVHEVKNLEGVECLTKDGFRKVRKIIRHKARILYKIICGPGNYSVLTTGSHSIFTLTREGLIPKRVSCLKMGEWLLSPRKVESFREMKEVFVSKYVPCLVENEKVRQERINYWKKIVSQIGEKTISQLSREYGHSRKTIREYYRSFENNFSDLLNDWVVDLSFIHHKTSKCKIPTKIEFSREFGEFLGYAVAEGSAKRKREQVSSYIFTLGNEPNLAQKILFLYRKIFLQKAGTVRKIKSRTGKWQYNVNLGNRIVSELLVNLVGDGFINKRVPQIIFNAPEKIKIGFFKALIEGDGHERIRKSHCQHEFSLKTGSRRLAADTVFLLKTMGIFSWVEAEEKSYKVVVSQNDLKTLGINSGLSLKYSFRTRVEGIPRELLGYGLRGQKRIDKERIAIWETLPNLKSKKQKASAVRYGLLNKRGQITEKGKKLLFLYKLSQDWSFKEVRNVEVVKLKNPSYVYDLVVEGNHSFVGGLGGLLLHNTGGEPTLQLDLPLFLAKLKKLGFATMIETNASRPEAIRALLAKKLLDYITVDIKGPLDSHYSRVADIKKSLKLILKAALPFELRTTVVPGIHDRKVLLQMARQLRRHATWHAAHVKFNWFLQTFQPKNCLDPEFNKLKPYSRIEMESFLKAVRKIIPTAELR